MRPSRLASVVALLLIPLAAPSPAQEPDRPAGTKPSARPQSDPQDLALRQLLREALRELKAAEKQDADDEEPMSDRDGPQGRVDAFKAIAKAQARLGDRESAQATWQDAMDLASALRELPSRAEALQAIASDQLAVGEKDAATATLQLALQAARAIKDKDDGRFRSFRAPWYESAPKRKAAILGRIAKAQADAEQRSASRNTFRQALAVADEIEDPLDRVNALSEIAEAEDSTGMGESWNRTFSVALAQNEEYERARDVEAALLAQAELKAFEPALKALDERLEGKLRAFALWVVAEEMAWAAKAGPSVPGSALKKALQLTETSQFETETRKQRVRAEIARAMARIGDIDGASLIADTLTTDVPNQKEEIGRMRVLVMVDVASEQLKAGKRDAVAKILRSLLDDNRPLANHLLPSIAKMLVETGDRQSAHRVAGLASSRETRVVVLAAISVALAEAGDRPAAQKTIEKAIRTADEIYDEDLWEEALSMSEDQPEHIGRKQRQSGPTNGYRKHSEALGQIAVAQVKCGDTQKAFQIVQGMSAKGNLFGIHPWVDTYKKIADVQIAARDFAGALATITTLPQAGGYFDRNPSDLLESLAKAQAEAGEAPKVLEWARQQKKADAKAAAIRGMAEGILLRRANRDVPQS